MALTHEDDSVPVDVLARGQVTDGADKVLDALVPLDAGAGGGWGRPAAASVVQPKERDPFW